IWAAWSGSWARRRLSRVAAVTSWTVTRVPPRRSRLTSSRTRARALLRGRSPLPALWALGARRGRGRASFVALALMVGSAVLRAAAPLFAGGERSGGATRCRPQRATLMSSSTAPTRAIGGRAANSRAARWLGAWPMLRATLTAGGAGTRVQAYQAANQGSPLR